jgi:hypothetical protein
MIFGKDPPALPFAGVFDSGFNSLRSRRIALAQQLFYAIETANAMGGSVDVGELARGEN